MTINILLVDDHTIMRQGLRALLAEEPDLRIIGEAKDGLQAIQMAASILPDIIVLDLGMPGLSGLEVTFQIRQLNPKARIVILSMYDKEGYVAEALRNGASGYVLKGADSQELAKALRKVMHGEVYLSPPFTVEGVQAYLTKQRENELDPYEILTPREREVLQLAAQGLSNPEIALRLGLSTRTVETHRSNILRKLDLSSQTELVRYAVRKNILPDQDIDLVRK